MMNLLRQALDHWRIWLRLVLLRGALRLDELLNRKDFEAAEAIAALAALGWGIILLAPADTFGSSVSFHALSLLISEPMTGAIMLIVGLTGLTALFANWHYVRRHMTFIMFVVWFFLTWLFWISNFWTTGTAIYPLLAAAAGWAYLRLRHHP